MTTAKTTAKVLTPSSANCASPVGDARVPNNHNNYYVLRQDVLICWSQ